MSEPVKRGRWVGGAATRDGGMTTGRGPRGPATHRPHDRVREREREGRERERERERDRGEAGPRTGCMIAAGSKYSTVWW